MFRMQSRAVTMAAILPAFTLCLSLAGTVQAQITVAGSTGANGNYTELNLAFAAINANPAQAGNAIVITVTGDTTETASAVLNQPATSSWTSLTISPSGGGARTISGAIAGHLIDLNGADAVTINGLNSGGNSLTIDNTLSGATSTAIRFINDATGNTVTNSTIKSAGNAITVGTIFFSTGTTTGNTGNTISNNKINSSSPGFATNAILSTGTSATIFNTGTISGNEISDYFSATVVSRGINLTATGNSAWSINNNKLFQTATRVFTTANTHAGIFVGGGAGYTINGNVIGFADAAGTGTTNLIGNSEDLPGFPASYLPSGTATATAWNGIRAAFTAGGAVSNIQGNTVGGVALYSSNSAFVTFIGISVPSGNANVGGPLPANGNTIGATSGGGTTSPASIYLAINSATTATVMVPMFLVSTNTVVAQNNSIGSIDVSGVGNTNSGSLANIIAQGAGGVFTVSNNTIGNSTPQNIRIGYMTTTGNVGDPLTNAGGILVQTTTASTGTMTGIDNQNATGAPLNITSNTIRNLASSISHTGPTGSSAFLGILQRGAVPGVINVNDNQLGTATEPCLTLPFATASTAQVNSILNTGGVAGTTVNLNNNTVQGLVLAASGQTLGVSNQSATVGVAININNNRLGTATQDFCTYSATSPGNIVGYFNSNGAVGALLTMTGNDIRRVVNTVPGTGGLTCYNNQAPNVSTNISNNTITNITQNTEGASFAIMFRNSVVHAAGSTHNVNNNSIVGTYTKTGGSGAVTFYLAASTSPSTVTEINSGNNFSNINLTGTTGVVNGWANVDGAAAGGSRKTVTNNTFSNITGGTGEMTVLQVSFSDPTFDGNNVSGNTISNITNENSITGILSESQNQNFFKNIICNLTANGPGATCDGISIEDGTTTNVFNNLIANLSAPTADNFNDPVRGISLTSITDPSVINVSYNTIFLNASSTGTDFGTSGIFHAASSTATMAHLTMRNNAIVNLSTPNGAGLTVAFRRSGTELDNYDTASNNNDFYAGSPDASHLIYHDTVNSNQTLASYKALVTPRDSASITANPTFLSTSCGNAGFLHVDPSDGSLDGLGTPIAGITDDVDGDVRNATTPDIGADEYTVGGCVCDKNIDGIGGDGDAADLTMFINAVLGNPVPPAALIRSDVNCDTFVNGLDIQPFVPCFLAP